MGSSSCPRHEQVFAILPILSLMTSEHVSVHVFYFDIPKPMPAFHSKLYSILYEYTPVLQLMISSILCFVVKDDSIFWMMVESLTAISPGHDGREPDWCALRAELLMVGELKFGRFRVNLPNPPHSKLPEH